jgi:hypothetical protein
VTVYLAAAEQVMAPVRSLWWAWLLHRLCPEALKYAERPCSDPNFQTGSTLLEPSLSYTSHAVVGCPARDTNARLQPLSFMHVRLVQQLRPINSSPNHCRGHGAQWLREGKHRFFAQEFCLRVAPAPSALETAQSFKASLKTPVGRGLPLTMAVVAAHSNSAPERVADQQRESPR